MSVDLRGRFQRVAAATDDSDWADVLARSGIGSDPGRRPAVLAALAVAVSAGLVALVVLGLHLRPAAAAPAPGPSHVERRVANGTIAWLFRHELRGQSLAAAHVPIGSTTGSHWQPVRFARVIVPDTASGAKLAVSLIGKHGRNICLTVFLPRSTGGGGCAFGLDLKPVSVITMGGLGIEPRGGVVLAGLASDDVARIELFLPHGRRRRVSLVDNAFFAAVAGSDLPANLVSYDRRGLVIGTRASRGLHVLR